MTSAPDSAPLYLCSVAPLVGATTKPLCSACGASSFHVVVADARSVRRTFLPPSYRPLRDTGGQVQPLAYVIVFMRASVLSQSPVCARFVVYGCLCCPLSDSMLSDFSELCAKVCSVKRKDVPKELHSFEDSTIIATRHRGEGGGEGEALGGQYSCEHHRLDGRLRSKNI